MVGKLTLLLGFGAGYLVGARAGREQYDRIATKARGMWRDPRVQEQVDRAKIAATEAKDKVTDTVASQTDGAPGVSGL